MNSLMSWVLLRAGSRRLALVVLLFGSGCAGKTVVWIHRSNPNAVLSMDAARCENEAMVGIRPFRNPTVGERIAADYEKATYIQNCLIALGWIPARPEDVRKAKAILASESVPRHEDEWRGSRSGAGSSSRKPLKPEPPKRATARPALEGPCDEVDGVEPGEATIEVSAPAWIIYKGKLLGPAPVTAKFPAGCVEVTVRGRRNDAEFPVRFDVLSGERRTHRFEIE